MLLTFLSATVLTSACSPVKPPHKQTFEKFSERRAPRDNLAMANGNYDPSSEKKSGFVPYEGVISVSNPTTSVDGKTKLGEIVVEQKASGSQSTEAGKDQKATQPQKSLLERLLGKLNVTDEESPIYIAENTSPRAPKQNVVSGYNFGQGSSNGQSIYEIADEVIPAQPVTKIEARKIEPIPETAVVLLAQTKEVTQGVYNPAAPLVEVPEVPSKEQMQQKGDDVKNEPELKNIPETPEKFKDAEPKQPNNKDLKKPETVIPNQMKKDGSEKIEDKEKMAQPAAEKKAQSKNLPVKHDKKKISAYDFGGGVKKDDFKISDAKAKIMRSHGVEVVSGELGELKK